MGSDSYLSRLRRVPQLDVGAFGPVLHFGPPIIMQYLEHLSDSHWAHLLSGLIILLFYAHVNKITHMFFWFGYGLGYGYGMVTVIGGFSADFPWDNPMDRPMDCPADSP